MEVVPELMLTDNISGHLDTLSNNVSALMVQLKNIQNDLKNVQKDYGKVLRDHNKSLRKKKKGSRTPSGFAKPSKITLELAKFLSLDPDIMVPRNEVTKNINEYIVKHSLRNKEDQRIIEPNDELSKLLKLEGTESLTYFNLQRFMKVHFIKSPPASSPPVSV